MKRYIFADPLHGAVAKLQPDSMSTPIAAVPDSHPLNGAPCLSFEVPASIPNRHGASLTIEWPREAGLAPYVMHGILETITAGGGGFECDIFRGQKVGGIRPFRLDGHFCRYSDDGSEMLINEASGFRAFSRYVNGEASQLDAFLASCVENRINMIRVAAMQDTTLYLPQPELRYRIHPADHPNFFSLVDGFMDYAASYGINVDWMCCTQTQTILPDKNDQVRFVQGMFDVLHDRYCLVSKGNEQYVYDNTFVDAVRLLPKPAGAKFLLSTGSKGAGDESAIEPLGDLIEYHGNDLNEWWRKAHNAWEMANRYDRGGYVSENTRTDKDTSLIHFEDAGKTEIAMTLGAIIHTPEGKNADLFQFSLPWIAAHNQGVFAGGVNYRRGQYDRIFNTDVLREYSMTMPGLGVYRWTVRF